MFNSSLIESRSGSGDAQNRVPWDRPWKDILTIVAIGVIANILLIANPGFYSHDELDWQNRIARNDDPWSFGLGNPTTSSFFRLLGAMVISASFRLPLQPIGAHLTEVLISIATACLLHRAVALFRPDRALAAAILFMLTPGFAYSVGWIAAGFDVQFTFWGVSSILCAILYWRGGRLSFLLLSLISFAAALCCKETALSIPICALLVMFIDRRQVDRRRAVILASFVTGLVALYFAFRMTRILQMAASGTGGYRFGSSLGFLNNALPYFGFPFAAGVQEIQSFP